MCIPKACLVWTVILLQGLIISFLSDGIYGAITVTPANKDQGGIYGATPVTQGEKDQDGIYGSTPVTQGEKDQDTPVTPADKDQDGIHGATRVTPADKDQGVFGSDCNWQFFKHYEQKGCTAVLGKNGCPERFQCEPLSDEDMESCVHNGKIYQIGEAINDLGPCDSCTCSGDPGSAYIECDAVDCPDWDTKNKSCYMGFKPNDCCPVEICPNDKETKTICKYNGKEYKAGDYIQTTKPCRGCICTEEWSDEDGPGCSDVHCLFGIYAQKIRGGCLPIYNEKGCCMTEVYCDGIYGATPVTPADKDQENYCNYRGRYYEKGSSAILETDKYQCIECKCTTPPDFTCLRKACPPKPRYDCKTVYGQCCPKYECS